MSGKKIIKTREPGPEFQALASDWKPQVRRAWLVKPPIAESALGAKSATDPGTESALGTNLATAPSTESALGAKLATAPITESALGANLATAPSTESALGTNLATAPSTESALGTNLATAPSTESALGTNLATAPSTESALGAKLATAPSARWAPAAAGEFTTGGWTKVPNVFWEVVSVDLNSRALRVLLYVARQTFGFHRPEVALSAAEIANATRIHRTHVFKTVKELVEAGYLVKAAGGGRDKNAYSIGSRLGGIRVGAGSEHQVGTSRGSQFSHYSERRVGAATGSRIGVSTESYEVSEINKLAGFSPLSKKDLNESFERNSLSNAPLEWIRYSDTLTVKARERANAIFVGLKQRFPQDAANEIAACPENLRAFGAPDGTPWSEIKSPHGLMESAWPQLRDFFRGKRAAQQQTEASTQARARERDAIERRAAADDAVLVEQARIARTAFVAAFPDEAMQVGQFEKFCPRWVSNPLTEPGRSLAIDAWYHAAREAQT